MLTSYGLKDIQTIEGDILTLQSAKDESRFNLTLSNEKTNWPSYSAFRLFSYFPERKRLDTQYRFEVPATDISAEIINRFWPKEQLRFFDELAEVHYNLTLAKGKAHDVKAKIIANYKEDKFVPKHNLELHRQHPLSCFQQIGALVSMNTESFSLFMEQSALRRG